MLAVPLEEIVGGVVARIGRHEVREFEGDDLFGKRGSRLNFKPEIAPVRRGELDRHIPVKAFKVRPDMDVVLPPKFNDPLHKVWQFLVMHLAILEGAIGDHFVGFGKNPVPMLEAFRQGHRIFSKLLRPLRIWRDQDGLVRNVLAMPADMVE